MTSTAILSRRRILSTAGLLALALTAPTLGCGSLQAAVQSGEVKTDVEEFLTVANSVLTWAKDAWAELPAAVQAAAGAAWTTALGAAGAAIAVVEDALVAYTDATPDGGAAAINWVALFSDVGSAVATLVTTIAALVAGTGEALRGQPKFVASPFAHDSVARAAKAAAQVKAFKAPGAK
jgi:hypothetical protein